LYAFRVHDGTGYGPYDQLPDGQFSVGGLSFHPPCAPRSQFYGQELEVRYGPWDDSDVSFHAPLIGRWGIGDPIRVRATYEVINWLFDQR
jgi:hypothetical protein